MAVLQSVRRGIASVSLPEMVERTQSEKVSKIVLAKLQDEAFVDGQKPETRLNQRCLR
jgi:hypothetical protein